MFIYWELLKFGTIESQSPKWYSKELLRKFEFEFESHPKKELFWIMTSAFWQDSTETLKLAVGAG